MRDNPGAALAPDLVRQGYALSTLVLEENTLVFINIDSKEKMASRQLAFLLAVLGVLLTIVIYLAPTTQGVSENQVSIEEVELVHILLDKIQTETPELERFVEGFRISFSENPGLLNIDFFKADTDSQRRFLLKTILANGHSPSDSEIAVVGE